MITPTRRPGANAPEHPADDASIPVLTERVGLPPLDFDTTLPMVDTTLPAEEALYPDLEAPTLPPVEIAPAQAPTTAVHGQAVAPAATEAPVVADDALHWERLERDLRASILRDIANQLPGQIENVIQARMQPALERLLAELAAEARMAIAATLRQVIEHAVTAELQRLRESHQGPR